MNVSFYYRPKRESCSIEDLFSRVRAEFPEQITTADYRVQPRSGVFRTFRNARRVQGDVNHITGDINYLAIALDRHRTILTVHDIGHYEESLHGWKRWLYRLMWFELPLRSVRVVTAVSEFTRGRLIAVFGVDPARIVTIHNCFPRHFDFCPRPFNEREPNILVVGTAPHKNLNRLIEALQGMRCRLSIVGRLSCDQRRRLDATATMYSNCFGLSSSELYQRYVECDIVYFASLYEGFGLPIIEGQAVGRPVITSTAASMPEAAGNGALYVDPFSVGEIKAGITRLINDSTYRSELVELGRQNVLRFHPSIIAEKYYALYRMVSPR